MISALIKFPKRVFNRIRRLFARDPNRWLKQRKRLLHIGANDGPEIPLYAQFGLEVLWVEALPDAFVKLQANLEGYTKQSAVLALLTDVEGQEHMFNVASNEGASSSIFDFKDHVKLWPEISYVKQLKLTSRRLDRLLEEKGLPQGFFDSAVLDVQGAELLVLRGAGRYLEGMKYVCCEAADFEAYAGACNLDTLSNFMRDNGFEVLEKALFHQVKSVGSYYNVLYKNTRES